MSLQEVVVTGYGVQRKSDVTGAILPSPSVRQVRKGILPPAPALEFNTEGYSAIHENGFKSPVKEPLSTFSIDVDACITATSGGSSCRHCLMPFASKK